VGTAISLAGASLCDPASRRWTSVRGMLTFRTSLTFAVMAFIVALAVLLIAIQVRTLRWATNEAASAYMDATSSKALGRLQTEITAIASLVHVLATSSSVTDSNERTETGPAIPLFKVALQELPQMDSIYAGFEMALGCRCGALANSTMSSARGYVQRPVPTLRSIWSAPPRVANCRCDEFLKISRATKSDKLIFGNTDTTRASGPGIARR